MNIKEIKVYFKQQGLEVEDHGHAYTVNGGKLRSFSSLLKQFKIMKKEEKKQQAEVDKGEKKHKETVEVNTHIPHYTKNKR